jgi:KUP system potassium uptake protein
VVPIALGILTGLFAIQQFGTQKIGRFFGPMMMIWFLMLAVLGAYEIREELMVLKAFNPYYGLHFLFTNPGSILLLGAIFLCTTGAEALYTDLGHCGLKNIRMTWIFVKLSLILNYLGQGAWILSHKDQVNDLTNPFYAIMPEWFLPAGIVIATSAAIIASQALITGSYTIISEAISLNFWPKIRIKYPTLEKGQMYIASINWILWISCLGVVLLFRESSNMEAAYGLSITITMLATTLLMTTWLSMKRVSRPVVMLFMMIYLLIEGSFLYANLFKFTHGGWFTILAGGILFIIMFTWYNGRKISNRYLRFLPIYQYLDVIKELKDDTSVPKIATNLAFITKANRMEDIESKIIQSLLTNNPKRADHYWLIHVDIADSPHTREYKVTHIMPGILTRVDFYLGFKVQRKINSMFKQVVYEMGKTGEIDIFSGFPSLRKFNILSDFRFIIINRLHVTDLDFNFFEKIIINFYILLIRISLSDVKAYGFDTSTVYVEQVPLGYDIVPKFDLKRR